MFSQACLRAKEFSRETILVPSLRQNFLLSTLKFSTCWKVGSRVVNSRYCVEKYQHKRVACHCYQKLTQTNQEKLRQMFLNWMLQSKESSPENFNTLAITLKLGFKLGFKTRASRGNHGNLTHQGPRGNMHKLFDCISIPLKHFLACLIFHREEIRLRHLHKRTNTGSAPDIYIYIYINNKDIIIYIYI